MNKAKLLKANQEQRELVTQLSVNLGFLQSCNDTNKQRAILALLIERLTNLSASIEQTSEDIIDVYGEGEA